jgi:hypothetical protein
MGAIHPRAKEWVGRRLALAARAVAYGDEKVVYTGPVLSGCKVSSGSDEDYSLHVPPGRPLSVTITFNASLLRGDSVHSHGDAIGNCKFTSNLSGACGV